MVKGVGVNRDIIVHGEEDPYTEIIDEAVKAS